MATPYRSKADRAMLTADTVPIKDQYDLAVKAAMDKVRDLQKLEKKGPRWQYLRALGKVLDGMHDFVRVEHERIRADMRKNGEKED
jgi:hypothetical protein